MTKLNKILKNYQDIPDLKTRTIKYNKTNLHIIYLETISNTNQINNFILKNLTTTNTRTPLTNTLASPNLTQINNSQIDTYLFNGYTIILYKNKIYSLETKADLDRSISTPEIEPDIYGPKDTFIENYQKNIGLIKRRIKTKELKIKEYTLGKYTNTKTGLLYIEGLTNKNYIKEIDEKLKQINTSGIIDSGELKQYLIKEKITHFPRIKLTEKPNTAVNALLEGKIVIITDTSPFAIIAPAVLADFINPISDNYMYSNNINFIKILRLLCLFITIFTPAYYVAVATFNQETIPSTLLISFITQREGVPFPTTIEAIIMLIICEILRESDLRFPSKYGSAISILGALIIGDAAVNASIVSPIMIIIVSLTFISSMIFTSPEITSSLRSWRFFSLILSSIYGLFGLSISFILLIIDITSIYSLNLPYTFPLVPLNLPYLKETLISVKQQNKPKNFRKKNKKWKN